VIKPILPFLFAALLLGAGPATASSPQSTILAPDTVERTVSVMETLRAKGLMRQRTQIDMPQARIQAILEETAAEYGFNDADHLAAVISSTMQAFSALMVEEQVRAGAAQYERERADIENDSGIPAEQKEQMLAMMEARHNALKALAEDPNADAVRPYRDRIRALFTSE
jgi:hypothetical protein